MRTSFLLASSFLLGLAQSVAAQSLVIAPERPRPGSTVKLRYSAPPTAPTTPVKGIIYLYRDFAWQPDTLTMAATPAGWMATYRLPATAAGAVLRFYHGSAADTAGQASFFFAPRDKKGHRLPGGALAEALYRLPNRTPGIRRPALLPPAAQPATPAELKALLDEELARPGASPKQFVQPYLAIERAVLGKEFAAQAGPLLAPLLQEPLPTAEADLVALERIYHFELHQEEPAKQLEARILQLYPKSNFARLAIRERTVHHKTLPETQVALEQFFLQFPPRELPAGSDQTFVYYQAYTLLASIYFDAGNYNSLLALRPEWNFRTVNEVYRWNIMRAYTFKKVNYDTLYRVSTALIRDLIAKQNDNSVMEWGVIKDPVQARAESRRLLERPLETQISLLKDLGRNEEALSYFQYFSDDRRYADAELNEKHMRLLQALHRPAEVTAVLEQSARSNALTPLMTEQLKRDYQASHHGLVGYEQYLAGLRSKTGVADMKADVQAHLTNLPYQPFAMEDAKGQLVRSSDWKGKIVVLDFWATWCLPCIRAFPGMQLLVDQYAKDPQVEVYFVGTMQAGNYKEKDINYVKQQGYRFKLLFDGINPTSSSQDAVFRTFAPLFHSSGIPRKVILKDGVIRYSSEGYSGSPSQLAEEMAYAIELLKKDQTPAVGSSH